MSPGVAVRVVSLVPLTETAAETGKREFLRRAPCQCEDNTRHRSVQSEGTVITLTCRIEIQL